MPFEYDDAFTDALPPITTTEHFDAPGGVRLAATCVSRGHAVAILVVPGLFMTRSCPEHRILAARLSTVADVVTLDVRGHGDSDGQFSFGLREPNDIATVVEALGPRYTAVGGIGFSFGGHHLTTAASRGAELTAIATVGTPARFFRFHGRLLTHHLARTIGLAARRRAACSRLAFPSLGRRPSFLDAVGRLPGTPLLVAHGTEDWLVPHSDSHEIARRASDPVESLLVHGAGHAEGLIIEPTGQFIAGLTDFFRRYLYGSSIAAAS